MIMYLFLISTMIFFNMLLMGLYFYLKSHKAIHVLQQSGYDNKRLGRYMKSHYKFVYGINELLPIISILIMSKYLLVGLIINIFFMYYNIRFFNVANKRYVAKLGLRVTDRVKRLIISYSVTTLIVIMAILFAVHQDFLLDVYIMMTIITYGVYVLLLFANFINIPVEKRVRLKFQNMAKAKLAKHSDLFVVGITGSYGKTSIKNIIGNVLSEIEPTLITPESYNTPNGLTITVNNFLNPFHKNFIAEMGAYYEGEIKELVDLVEPKIGIVSSVGPQHLETFKTIETITRTKLELIEGLPSDGLGILNYDNKFIREYKIKNDVEVKYYSLENENADLYGFDVKYLDGMMAFKVKLNGEVYDIETKLLGIHSVQNIMAAILVAEYKKIDMNTVIDAIKRLKPVKNRLEYKYVNSKLSIIDDAFNSNPEGIKEAIKILGNYENKKRILITPGLIDLGSKTEEIHVELGKYLTEYVDEIYIIGKLNRENILKGITQTEFDLENVYECDNFIDGYELATNQDVEKIVLIANDLPDKFND